MAIVHLTMNFPTINFSANVGDIVYYSHSGVNTGGFNNTDLQNTRRLGPIVEILDRPGRFTVTVQYDDSVVSPPDDGDYISFAKDKTVNTSSLLGYYASVKFVNNSQEKIELFSIGSEIQESSK